MAFGKTQSDYCYEGSDVLRNNFGLTKQAELQIAESFVSRRMEAKILSNPSIAINRFGLNLLSSIHKALFGATYSWGGKHAQKQLLRTAQLSACRKISFLL